MELTRRDFLVGTAACAGALCAGCVTLNPAPSFDAGPEGTLLMPEALSMEGAQIKVRLPGIDEPVLVWRKDGNLGAASVVCTHRGCEVVFAPAAGTLDCPCHGSRFNADGTVLQGPAIRPLKKYRAEIEGNLLRLKAI
jgi:Rieske Fe-S protein